MQLATSSDQKIIQSMIASAVYENPKVQFQLGKQNYDKKVKWLSWFIYQFAMKRKAIYLSENKDALIIFMKSDQWQKRWHDFPLYFRLFFSVFNWSRIFQILRLESSLEKIRPHQTPYLYVWVLGSAPHSKGNGAAHELKQSLFKISQDLQLPIFAETAFEQNHIVFQRFGFETYHKQEFPEIPLCIHFMKRPVD
jgi:hypothetical protein